MINTTRVRWARLKLCSDCGGPRAEGLGMCKPCLTLRRSRNKTRYVTRKAAGMCVNCGENVVTPTYVHCEPCREIIAFKRENREIA